MISVLLYTLLFYFLYNFIVKFALPVYRTTREVKRQFSNMKQQGQQNTAGSASATPPPSATAKTSKPPAGEYIDFEEVK